MFFCKMSSYFFKLEQKILWVEKLKNNSKKIEMGSIIKLNYYKMIPYLVLEELLVTAKCEKKGSKKLSWNIEILLIRSQKLWVKTK